MCHHAARDLAYVRLCTPEGAKHTVYLGRWGSAAAQEVYDKLLREWLANDRVLPQNFATSPHPGTNGYSIVEMTADYLEWAQKHYVQAGQVSMEFGHLKSVLRTVVDMYAELPANEFGPKALLRVRDALVKKGWTRGYINAGVHRIRRAFAWAVAEELIAGETWYRLSAVRNLTRGRGGARDNPPVGPAPQSTIDAILPLVNRQVRALIELQLLTGARSGEICALRACDLKDLDKPVWKYIPASHKTEGHGIKRVIAIGPKAQEIIKPFLKAGRADAYLFSPAEAEQERRAEISAARKTPQSCGNRPGTNRVDAPRKQPGERYDSKSYFHALRDACAKAFPMPKEFAKDKEKEREWRRKHWIHPHQLRHSFATTVRTASGLDAAQVLLGHQHAAVTEIYAERDWKIAEKIIATVG